MSSQRPKQLLSTGWSYSTLLNFVKLRTLLVDKVSHKQYATLTTLAVVWALWSFTIFFWSELCWCALREQKSCCLQIGRMLRLLTFLSWVLLMEKGSQKWYATRTPVEVFWTFWSLRIFFWSKMWWWGLKEQNSCCLQIARILRSLTFLSWALSWSRKLATSDMQHSQFWQWFLPFGYPGLLTTLTTLAVVLALWSLRIFFWSELFWWGLKGQNSTFSQIDRILRCLSLLSWVLCWLRRVARSDMQRSQL